MIVLDGSHGEGGGQIIRTALSLSCLTGKPFRATKIRANRPEPGLKAQHVQCVKALQQLCGAKADGAEIGSTELLFVPGKLAAKTTSIDIGTAGSATLLLQAVLLPCMFAQKGHSLTITGGTDTAWSMPIDYFTNVLVPQYRRVCGLEVKLLKRGYYPKGGGIITLNIKPEVKRNEFDTFENFQLMLKHRRFTLLEQGQLMSIKGISHASKDLAGRQVAERQANSARKELQHYKVPIQITEEYSDTPSTGSGITLWAIFSAQTDDIDTAQPIRLGADCLGEQNKPAEQVGMEAAKNLIAEIESKAPVDRHLADNLIPLIALCKPSEFKTSKITEHALTNMHVVEAFLGKTFQEKDNIIKSE